MTTTLVTLTGNVSDAIGGEFDARRTKVYVRYNTDRVVTDDDIRLGGATVSPDSTGAFTLADVVAATTLVDNLQATVVIDYADPSTRQRAQETLGPYDLSAETGTVDIHDLEEVQALDPTWASAKTLEIQGYVDDASEYADDASDSADAAAASAAEATAIVIADADAAMATAINTDGSDTDIALTAKVEHPDKSWLSHTLGGTDEPGAFIAWTADDGYTYHASFAALAAARGFGITLFLTQLWADHAGTNATWGDTYITSAQINAMVAAGHEIGEHGYNHEDKPSIITSLGAAGAETFTNNVKSWIESTYNTTVRTGAYCGGIFTERACEIMGRSFDFFRATRGAVAYDGQNPYAVDSVPFDSLSEAQMKAYVDLAVANRSLLVFSMHGVAPASYAAMSTRIANVMDYATAQGARQGTFYQGMSERTKRKGNAASMEDALGNVFHRRGKFYRVGVQREDRLFGRHWWEYNETDDSSRFDGDSGFFEFRKPLRIASGAELRVGQRAIFPDGVLNSTTTVTSATAAFDDADIGRTITGTGIPALTTIASVTSPTTVVLSAAATATATGVTITIGRPAAPNAQFAGDAVFTKNPKIREPSGAPSISFETIAGVATGSIAPNFWTRAGSGGQMEQNSGTGGSYLILQNFGVKFNSHAGTLRVTVGAGKDGIDFGSAADATIKRAAAGIIDVGKLGVGNTAAATTLGTVTKKMEVFSSAGASLGFVPVYDAIT